MLMNETNQLISIVEKVIVNVSTGLIVRITNYVKLIIIIYHKGIDGKLKK